MEKLRKQLTRQLNAYHESIRALEARENAYLAAISRREHLASLLVNTRASQADHDVILDDTARVIDMLAELHHAMQNNRDALREATLLIDRLEKPEDRRILELRYTNLLKWREIAEEMEISEAAAKKRHERAIQALAELQQ